MPAILRPLKAYGLLEKQGEYFYLFGNIHYGIVSCAGGKVLFYEKVLQILFWNLLQNNSKNFHSINFPNTK